MTTPLLAEQPTTSPDGPEAASRAIRVPNTLIVVGMYLAATVLYIMLGRWQQITMVFPDERFYMKLAGSVADGHGLMWRGGDQPLRSALYVYAISPAWLLTSSAHAYEIARAMGAAMLCTLAFPVWIVGRRLLGDRTALAVTGLVLIGPWTVSAGVVMTENAALPLATASLLCAVMSLRDRDRRWFVLALVFAALASWARLQVAVIWPAMLVAYAGRTALAGRDWRTYVAAHRWRLATLLAISAIGFIGALALGRDATGTYGTLGSFKSSTGDLLSSVSKEWLHFVVLTGVVPVVALVAAAANPAAWRHPDARAALLVALPTVTFFVLLGGWFIAGAHVQWGIERYVFYCAPLLLILTAVVLRERLISPRRFWVAAALTVVPLLAGGQTGAVVEEQTVFAARLLLDGIVGGSAGRTSALLGLLVVLATGLVLKRQPARSAGGVLGVLAIVFAALTVTAWNWRVDLGRAYRSQLPASLSWVDDHANGPTARMFVFGNSGLGSTFDAFNEDVTAVYAPSTYQGSPDGGLACNWIADNRGVVEFLGDCKRGARVLWQNDPLARMTFYGGTELARDARMGQIIRIPTATPRVRSALIQPCNEPSIVIDRAAGRFYIQGNANCNPQLITKTYLDEEGTIELRYRGGTRARHVTLGEESWLLKPNLPTAIQVKVPSGVVERYLNIDWRTTVGEPRLEGAWLHTGGQRLSML